MSQFQEIKAEERSRIAKILTERGATQPCPRCGNQRFVIIGGYFSNVIQSDIKNIELAGATIPSVVSACERCGFLSQHAMGVLGLLPTGNKPVTSTSTSEKDG